MGIRFAPSPTGRFHIGNLRTAWVSHALSRSLGVPWVVRFEDIDTPRVVAGAREVQLQDLSALGLIPDRVLLQSKQREFHWEQFLRAIGEGKAYPCLCSRKEVQTALAELASAPHVEPNEYSGHCAGLDPEKFLSELRAQSQPRSLGWRFRRREGGGKRDPLIARTSSVLDSRFEPEKDSFTPAYTWACALDDTAEKYRAIVRASDLRHALAPQREIQAWFDPAATLPAAVHTALVVLEDGSRLEKRTRGVTWPEFQAAGWDPRRFGQMLDRSWHPPGQGWDRAGAVWNELPEQIFLNILIS